MSDDGEWGDTARMNNRIESRKKRKRRPREHSQEAVSERSGEAVNEHNRGVVSERFREAVNEYYRDIVGERFREAVNEHHQVVVSERNREVVSERSGEAVNERYREVVSMHSGDRNHYKKRRDYQTDVQNQLQTLIHNVPTEMSDSLNDTDPADLLDAVSGREESNGHHDSFRNGQTDTSAKLQLRKSTRKRSQKPRYLPYETEQEKPFLKIKLKKIKTVDSENSKKPKKRGRPSKADSLLKKETVEKQRIENVSDPIILVTNRILPMQSNNEESSNTRVQLVDDIKILPNVFKQKVLSQTFEKSTPSSTELFSLYRKCDIDVPPVAIVPEVIEERVSPDSSTVVCTMNGIEIANDACPPTDTEKSLSSISQHQDTSLSPLVPVIREETVIEDDLCSFSVVEEEERVSPDSLAVVCTMNGREISNDALCSLVDTEESFSSISHDRNTSLSPLVPVIKEEIVIEDEVGIDTKVTKVSPDSSVIDEQREIAKDALCPLTDTVESLGSQDTSLSPLVPVIKEETVIDDDLCNNSAISPVKSEVLEKIHVNHITSDVVAYLLHNVADKLQETERQINNQENSSNENDTKDFLNSNEVSINKVEVVPEESDINNNTNESKGTSDEVLCERPLEPHISVDTSVETVRRMNSENSLNLSKINEVPVNKVRVLQHESDINNNTNKSKGISETETLCEISNLQTTIDSLVEMGGETNQENLSNQNDTEVFLNTNEESINQLEVLPQDSDIHNDTNMSKGTSNGGALCEISSDLQTIIDLLVETDREPNKENLLNQSYTEVFLNTTEVLNNKLEVLPQDSDIHNDNNKLKRTSNVETLCETPALLTFVDISIETVRQLNKENSSIQNSTEDFINMSKLQIDKAIPNDSDVHNDINKSKNTMNVLAPPIIPEGECIQLEDGQLLSSVNTFETNSSFTTLDKNIETETDSDSERLIIDEKISMENGTINLHPAPKPLIRVRNPESLYAVGSINDSIHSINSSDTVPAQNHLIQNAKSKLGNIRRATTKRRMPRKWKNTTSCIQQETMSCQNNKTLYSSASFNEFKRKRKPKSSNGFVPSSSNCSAESGVLVNPTQAQTSHLLQNQYAMSQSSNQMPLNHSVVSDNMVENYAMRKKIKRRQNPKSDNTIIPMNSSAVSLSDSNILQSHTQAQTTHMSQNQYRKSQSNNQNPVNHFIVSDNMTERQKPKSDTTFAPMNGSAVSPSDLNILQSHTQAQTTHMLRNQYRKSQSRNQMPVNHFIVSDNKTERQKPISDTTFAPMNGSAMSPSHTQAQTTHMSQNQYRKSQSSNQMPVNHFIVSGNTTERQKPKSDTTFAPMNSSAASLSDSNILQSHTQAQTTHMSQNQYRKSQSNNQNPVNHFIVSDNMTERQKPKSDTTFAPMNGSAVSPSDLNILQSHTQAQTTHMLQNQYRKSQSRNQMPVNHFIVSNNKTERQKPISDTTFAPMNGSAMSPSHTQAQTTHMSQNQYRKSQSSNQMPVNHFIVSGNTTERQKPKSDTTFAPMNSSAASLSDSNILQSHTQAQMTHMSQNQYRKSQSNNQMPVNHFIVSDNMTERQKPKSDTTFAPMNGSAVSPSDLNILQSHTQAQTTHMLQNQYRKSQSRNQMPVNHFIVSDNKTERQKPISDTTFAPMNGSAMSPSHTQAQTTHMSENQYRKSQSSNQMPVNRFIVSDNTTERQKPKSDTTFAPMNGSAVSPSNLNILQSHTQAQTTHMSQNQYSKSQSSNQMPVNRLIVSDNTTERQKPTFAPMNGSAVSPSNLNMLQSHTQAQTTHMTQNQKIKSKSSNQMPVNHFTVSDSTTENTDNSMTYNKIRDRQKPKSDTTFVPMSNSIVLQLENRPQAQSSRVLQSQYPVSQSANQMPINHFVVSNNTIDNSYTTYDKIKNGQKLKLRTRIVPSNWNNPTTNSSVSRTQEQTSHTLQNQYQMSQSINQRSVNQSTDIQQHCNPVNQTQCIAGSNGYLNSTNSRNTLPAQVLETQQVQHCPNVGINNLYELNQQPSVSFSHAQQLQHCPNNYQNTNNCQHRLMQHNCCISQHFSNNSNQSRQQNFSSDQDHSPSFSDTLQIQNCNSNYQNLGHEQFKSREFNHCNVNLPSQCQQPTPFGNNLQTHQYVNHPNLSSQQRLVSHNCGNSQNACEINVNQTSGHLQFLRAPQVHQCETANIGQQFLQVLPANQQACCSQTKRMIIPYKPDMHCNTTSCIPCTQAIPTGNALQHNPVQCNPGPNYFVQNICDANMPILSQNTNEPRTRFAELAVPQACTNNDMDMIRGQFRTHPVSFSDISSSSYPMQQAQYSVNRMPSCDEHHPVQPTNEPLGQISDQLPEMNYRNRLPSYNEHHRVQQLNIPLDQISTHYHSRPSSYNEHHPVQPVIEAQHSCQQQIEMNCNIVNQFNQFSQYNQFNQ